METDENSVRRPLVESSTSKSDCTGNCVLVGPSGRKGELERSAKDLIRHRFSNPLGALTPAERYVAKYAAKEDTKVNRSLSGREMLNWYEMLTAIWLAATAVHKQRNLMRRSIITFEERPNTRERNLQRASVHSCLGGGNPSDIYLWWILWISICRIRRS